MSCRAHRFVKRLNEDLQYPKMFCWAQKMSCGAHLVILILNLGGQIVTDMANLSDVVLND